MADKTTCSTAEKMPVPVTSIDVAASWAALAGIAGVNVDHGNATLGGLVLDEPAELSESPGVLDESLLSGHTDALPDGAQVFHRDNIAGLTGTDDSFGDPVVKVGHPATLLPRQPFQEALGPFRAPGLERLPQPGVTPTDVQSVPSGELQAIGGGGKVINATVNANGVTVFGWKMDFVIDHNIDVELFRSSIVAEGGRSGFLLGKKPSLEVANGEWEPEPAHHCGDGDFPTLFVEGEGALVEAHAGGFELSGFGWFLFFS